MMNSVSRFGRHIMKHYQVLPLFGCVGFALSMATYASYWSLKKPDVGLKRWNYNVPWDTVKDREQYKLFSPNRDFKELPDRVKVEDVIKS